MSMLPKFDSAWFRPATEADRLGPKDVHPSQRAAVPSLEDFNNSPHYPLVMTPNPAAPGQKYYGSSDPSQKLPLNGVGGPIPFENEFWVGVFEMHIKGTPTTQNDKFDGKKRMFHAVFQGRYKQRRPAKFTHVGQEFTKPGKAPPFITDLILRAAGKSFSNTVKVDAYCECPYFYNPMLACHQIINVSRPGEEPALWEAQEDMRLMSPKLVDKDGVSPMPAEKRRKFCDNPANIEDMYWEPDYVYTQHVYQHLIDLANCRLNVAGLCGLDIAFAMNGQPFQVGLKNLDDGSQGLSMLIWHKRMLYEENEGLEAADGEQSSSSSLVQRFSKLGLGFKKNVVTGK